MGNFLTSIPKTIDFFINIREYILSNFNWMLLQSNLPPEKHIESNLTSFILFLFTFIIVIIVKLLSDIKLSLEDI